jgi:phosphatidylserine decarboxylase
MNLKNLRDRLLLQEDLNFLLTNRIPRRALTLLMGRVSRIRNRPFTRLGIALWKALGDLDLQDAETLEFDSLQACFTRRLRPGSRPQDARPAVLTAPCDGIVGAVGTVRQGELLQAKGLLYRFDELVGSATAAPAWEGATYVTLRLTSAMYHRFHAPADGRLRHVRSISGDTWNVNPIAVRRIERLFVRNERAVLDLLLDDGTPLLLVPVAAILVASLRLHALDATLGLRWQGPRELPCDQPVRKGDELGWFEHGSTIIVVAPAGLQLADGVQTGATLRVGQPLLMRPSAVPGSR